MQSDDAAVRLRDYQEEDHGQVLVLHRVAMEAVGAYKGDGPWNDDLRDIPKSYRGGKFLVLEVGSRIVSMGAIRNIDGRTCELKRMRTLPEFQGRGYGRRILHELLRLAKELGFERIMLDTSERQAAAIHLYESCGFEKYREEHSGDYLCMWYQRDL